MSATDQKSGRQSQVGPPLLAPGLSFAVLTVLGVALGASGPRPTTTPGELVAYLSTNTTIAAANGAVMCLASIPLVVWTSVAYRRLRRLGVTVPGATIGFAGGLLASAFLALSGLVAWAVASNADVVEPGAARVLTTLSFAAGGPAFAGSFALLMAGVSVPPLLLGLLPRALAWAGLALAAIGMVATFSLFTSVLYFLLPVTRFGGLLWLLATSALLVKVRPRRSGSVTGQSKRPEATV